MGFATEKTIECVVPGGTSKPIGWREFHPAKFCSTAGVALLSVMRGESLIGMPVVEYAGRDIEDLLMILAEMSIRSLTRLRWSMSGDICHQLRRQRAGEWSQLRTFQQRCFVTSRVPDRNQMTQQVGVILLGVAADERETADESHSTILACSGELGLGGTLPE